MPFLGSVLYSIQITWFT